MPIWKVVLIMSEFKVNKIIEIARQLGIEVEANSDRPGMFIIDENGNKKEATFEDLFLDLKELVGKEGYDG
jgi:hypothetical protein